VGAPRWFDERYVEGCIRSLEAAAEAIYRSIGVLSALRSVVDERSVKLIECAVEYLETAVNHIKGILLDLYELRGG